MEHYSHKIGNNFWHLEWCTKYRYKMMRKLENKNLAESAIRKAAHENRIVIHEIAVMPDHVHLLVSLPNGMTDSKALEIKKKPDCATQEDTSGLQETMRQLLDTMTLKHVHII